MKERLNSIERQIEDLRRKKREIQEKYSASIVKLISKIGLEEIDKEMLVGAILSIENADTNTREGWRQAGEKFLAQKYSTRNRKAA